MDADLTPTRENETAQPTEPGVPAQPVEPAPLAASDATAAPDGSPAPDAPPEPALPEVVAGETPAAAAVVENAAPAEGAAPAPAEPATEPPTEQAQEPAAEPAPEQPEQQEQPEQPADPQGMLVLGGAPLRTESEPEPVEEAPDPADVCGECGGTFGAEGYCDQCGAARPDERLHYELDAGHGVAAVCDRGIRHVTNEDAVAVAADDDGTRRFALVVSDGVSTAPRSAEASTAAVQAALDVLTSNRSTGLAGVAAALAGALSRRLVAATEAAADAVREVTERPDTSGPDLSGIRKAGHPACTFVAAIVEGETAAIGSLGDSRAYWLPDAGGPQRLTTDDSWANEQIRLGVDPEEAERGPHAHTITKWLGVDCPDMTPEVTTLTLGEPGYLMVCSDGLWNYASAPEEIDAALQQARSALPAEAGVLDLASALVDWANARGGQDNVTVALARIDGPAPHGDEQRDQERDEQRVEQQGAEQRGDEQQGEVLAPVNPVGDTEPRQEND